jgi:hypothetical protein
MPAALAWTELATPCCAAINSNNSTITVHCVPTDPLSGNPAIDGVASDLSASNGAPIRLKQTEPGGGSNRLRHTARPFA